MGAKVHRPSRGRYGSFLSTLVGEGTNCIIAVRYMAALHLKLGRFLLAQAQSLLTLGETWAGIGRGKVSHDLLIMRSELRCLLRGAERTLKIGRIGKKWRGLVNKSAGSIPHRNLP